MQKLSDTIAKGQLNPPSKKSQVPIAVKFETILLTSIIKRDTSERTSTFKKRLRASTSWSA